MRDWGIISLTAKDITEDEALQVRTLILNDLSTDHQHRIRSIEDLEKFKNLEVLNINYHALTSDLTPLANLSKLTKLYLSENQISDLTPLANLTNLKVLYLNKNQISDIKPLATLTNLTELNLGTNQISDITPLKSLTKLTKLDATRQYITLRSESSMVDLAKEIKGAGSVQFYKDRKFIDSVLTYKNGMENPYEVYAMDGKNYSATIRIEFPIQFKDEHLKNSILSYMKTQHLIDQSAEYITRGDALKVKELMLNEKSIQSIEGLENFKNLTDLNLNNNQISDIAPLAALTNLTQLELNKNQISDITPLTNLTNLTSLRLDNNQISDITPLKSLTKLTDFHANNQTITL